VRRATVALIAAAVLAGCGGNGPATRLTIRVTDVTDPSSPRTYRLECGPSAGTARNARAMCKALRRQPDMLETPRQVVCGPNASPRTTVKVSGRYRGRHVQAKFQDGCSTGANDGFGAWIDVLEAA
jgi:hypothetical protein